MIKVNLIDGSGTGRSARVNSFGQVVVGPLDSSEPTFHELDTDDVPVGFIQARAGEQFIVTSLIVNSSRDTSVNGALVEVYESDAFASANITKSLLKVDIPRLTAIPFNPSNFEITPGAFVNAVSDSTSVFLTISGFYVTIVPNIVRGVPQ
jgi:hypothetical protein